MAATIILRRSVRPSTISSFSRASAHAASSVPAQVRKSFAEKRSPITSLIASLMCRQRLPERDQLLVLPLLPPADGFFSVPVLPAAFLIAADRHELRLGIAADDHVPPRRRQPQRPDPAQLAPGRALVAKAALRGADPAVARLLEELDLR